MNRNIIKHCIHLALKKHGPSHPHWGYKSVHYTFIVQNNKILGIGVNRPDAPGIKDLGYTTRHSEVDGWLRTRGIIDREFSWEAVNVRLLRQKPYDLADAAPCPRCMRFLKSKGCKHVYFTTNHQQVAKIIY